MTVMNDTVKLYGLSINDAKTWVKDVISMWSFYMNKDDYNFIKENYNVDKNTVNDITDEQAAELFELLDDMGIIEISDLYNSDIY